MFYNTPTRHYGHYKYSAPALLQRLINIYLYALIFSQTSRNVNSMFLPCLSWAGSRLHSGGSSLFLCCLWLFQPSKLSRISSSHYLSSKYLSMYASLWSWWMPHMLRRGSNLSYLCTEFCLCSQAPTKCFIFSHCLSPAERTYWQEFFFGILHGPKSVTIGWRVLGNLLFLD